MKEFVNNVLNTLKTNPDINSNSVIKLIVEATENKLNEGVGVFSAYSYLKNSLKDLNEHIDNESLTVLLENFNKFENNDSVKLIDVFNEVGIKDMLESIKSSNLYSTPAIMHATEVLLESINKGIPQFKLIESFKKAFSNFQYEEIINESFSKLDSYVNDNYDRLLVMDAIYEMKQINLYTPVAEQLSKMLLEDKFTSNAIRNKINSEIPIVKRLVESLSLYESSKSNDFSIGLGNATCDVEDVILPMTKINESTVLAYMDNKFMVISKDSVMENEEISNIAVVEPSYVRENFEAFYKLCESLSALKFKQLGNEMIAEGLEHLNVKLNVNENNKVTLNVNGNAINESTDFNYNEVLKMESPDTRMHFKTILEHIDTIYNAPFIKHIKSKSGDKEAFIINVNESYQVCEIKNNVEREWLPNLDKAKLYSFIYENFNYDISPAFKDDIENVKTDINKINSEMESLSKNINKLEESVNEIDAAINSGEIDEAYLTKLENLKEEIQDKITSLKEAYVDLDIKKKEKLAYK